MSLQRHTVEIAFLMFLISRSSSATCYYPDGSASSERPCRDPSLACCPADTYCLTNGLCWNSKKFFVFRGSCRDKSWNDPNCPGFCRQYIPWSGKVLAPCNDSGSFTCNYNCTASNLTIPHGDIVLRDDQISSPFCNSSLPSTSASASSTFSSPSSTSTSMPLSPTPDKNCTNCTTSSADHSPAYRSPKLSAVAAGIGVSLGLAWLATLVFLGRERRKTRLLEQEKTHWKGVARDCQHAKRERNPNGLGGGIAELMEDQSQHEMPVEPLAHELQA